MDEALGLPETRGCHAGDEEKNDALNGIWPHRQPGCRRRPFLYRYPNRQHGHDKHAFGGLLDLARLRRDHSCQRPSLGRQVGQTLPLQRDLPPRGCRRDGGCALADALVTIKKSPVRGFFDLSQKVDLRNSEE